MTDIDPRIQVRISDEVAAWLADRAQRMHTVSHHQQARIELGMWHAALDAELRRIQLTLAQASCIADVLNSPILDPALSGNVPRVFWLVTDACQLAKSDRFGGLSSYGVKWGIDEAALLGYLQTLGPTADHALHDAVSRWWKTDQEATVAGWAAVGLRVSVPDAA